MCVCVCVYSVCVYSVCVYVCTVSVCVQCVCVGFKYIYICVCIWTIMYIKYGISVSVNLIHSFPISIDRRLDYTALHSTALHSTELD